MKTFREEVKTTVIQVAQKLYADQEVVIFDKSFEPLFIGWACHLRARNDLLDLEIRDISLHKNALHIHTYKEVE